MNDRQFLLRLAAHHARLASQFKRQAGMKDDSEISITNDPVYDMFLDSNLGFEQMLKDAVYMYGSESDSAYSDCEKAIAMSKAMRQAYEKWIDDTGSKPDFDVDEVIDLADFTIDRIRSLVTECYEGTGERIDEQMLIKRVVDTVKYVFGIKSYNHGYVY